MSRNVNNYAIVYYRYIPHILSLRLLRTALIAKEIDGELTDGMAQLADQAGMSRSTASRFMAGRATSISVALNVCRVLGLKFEDVAVPIPEALALRLARDDAYRRSEGNVTFPTGDFLMLPEARTLRAAFQLPEPGP